MGTCRCVDIIRQGREVVRGVAVVVGVVVVGVVVVGVVVVGVVTRQNTVSKSHKYFVLCFIHHLLTKISLR